ncbi:hypothetical protein [Halorubrum sp. DTA46]|uniref:hypothetical protein n=1 Tax=Halorubrum sp. DTA46 TaxID=3402162 RepID=UPI003AB0EDFF
MREFPPLPNVADFDAPEDLLSGHLWVVELVDGTGLRFRMDESGLLRFGGPERTYETVADVPLALRPAVRSVRDRFDRETLRASVEDPSDVVFFGVATRYRGVDYDWERLPPFLGTDIWRSGASEKSDGEFGAFRPPDATAAIFEGVGLDPVTVVEREVNARDFDPEDYEMPPSTWRDGSVAGVVVRNKRGGRGRLVADGASGGRQSTDGLADETVAGRADTDAGSSASASVTAVAARHANDDRLGRAAASIERGGVAATVDALADRTVELVARETPVRFKNRPGRAGKNRPGGDSAVDADRFRAAVVDLARAFLEEPPDEGS